MHIISLHAIMQECESELIQQPPCSPDLAASDNYFFIRMKTELRGWYHHHHCSGPLSGGLRSQLLQRILMLHNCWTHCINVCSDYV